MSLFKLDILPALKGQRFWVQTADAGYTRLTPSRPTDNALPAYTILSKSRPQRTRLSIQFFGKRIAKLATIFFLMVVFVFATGSSGSFMPKFSGDFLNLLGVIGAVIGVITFLVSIWQMVSSAIDKMQAELESAINKIQAESTMRDRLHDEQISKLWTKVEGLDTAVDYHVSSYGHNGTIEELARTKDEVANIKAVAAVNSQLGSILLRVENLENIKNS